ncbi:ferrous iron transport protein B [Vibrio sp. WXL210]|uniref:ferrous iron transport protein B n=1 Tax=Vibrio sp. WXL210 TaxID=3450709 RepID=UPI003EC565D0
MQRKKVLLAGQQNAGKSTIFNFLTGARQHVANYPGVTVDKKVGYFSIGSSSYQLVDLPGTYSLTSFSLEERVARRALLEEQADTVLNVIDAANLSRSLHLTLQLLELELPVAVTLNMMDVAEREGFKIDAQKLEHALGVPVAQCVGRLGKGVEDVSAIIDSVRQSNFCVPYPELEATITQLTAAITPQKQVKLPPLRWLALRLLENDAEAISLLNRELDNTSFDQITELVKQHQHRLKSTLSSSVSDYIVAQRHKVVGEVLAQVVTEQPSQQRHSSWTQKLDGVILNRYAAPFFLILTVFVIYQCAIVYGYELTNYWWPVLASLREFIAGILPDAGFLHDPYVRSMGLWIVDSANTLLNYIPIFIILFALIAIVEDSGYMARIAFISDRILHRFGLHGQSTLPMILAGVFAGGCAVPGVMATKGIPDNRARLATILTVPYMNCLAKVPLYTLLLGIFFVESKSLMTFYIATISIIAALLVSKLLTKTVLRKTETAPFVMELPRYNLPTLRGVAIRSLERTWLYVRKVGTIVLAVSTVIFVLLQFPGIDAEDERHFVADAKVAVAKFEQALAKTEYVGRFDQQSIPELVNFYNDFRQAKLNAKGAEASSKVNERFAQRNAQFFEVTAPPKGNQDARSVNRALRKLSSDRKRIRREMRELRLENSLLGMFGRSLEPVTQYAGFDWKINVALFSSFAARESSVATLGVLFQQDEDSNQKLEQRMGESQELAGHGEIAAVALILFFILYPPCLATVMVIRVQTGEYKWMLLSIFLPTLIGFTVATMTYSLGGYFALSGIELMSVVYFSALVMLLVLGLKDSFVRSKQPDEIAVKNI